MTMESISPTPRSNAPLWRSLALALSWLVIVNAFALLALNRINVRPDNAFEWMSPEIFKARQSWDWVALHNRWDSYWFLDVAEKGYYLRGERRQANVVFFPLYPLLVRGVGYLTGGDLPLAGWVVSSLFLLLAAAMLTRFVQIFHPEIDAGQAVLCLLVFPTAFFLNAVYSESLFLCLSLGVFWAALRGRFWLAGACCALASATRVAGLFLCVPLLMEFLQTYGWRGLLSRRVAALVLAPGGALLFFGYHWLAFGDFFLYLKVQNWWGRDFVTGMGDFVVRTHPDMVNTVIECAYAVGALGMALAVFRNLRPSYGIYMLVSLGVALSSGTTFAIARYAMVLFPIYLLAARIASPVGRQAWLIASTLLMGLHTILFVNHYWAG
jgi:hypothetical protein